MKFKMLMLVAVLLMAYGVSQAQTTDSIYIELYDVTNDAIIPNGADIFAYEADGVTPIQYQVRMYVENSFAIFGASMGLVFSSDGNLNVNWESQTGGWGFGGQNLGCACVTVPGGSRFNPLAGTGSWEATGLLVTEQNLTNPAPDSILIGGVAFFNGLNTGPLENMFNYHFSLDIANGATASLDIDSGRVGPSGDFVWTNELGNNSVPKFAPVLGFTVSFLNDAEDGTSGTPATYSLDQNFPNPFNPATRISYSVARKGEVDIAIFNILGQKVRTLVDGELKDAGAYEVIWNGDDDRGAQVASGIYFYKMQSNEYVETRKMVLMR